LVIFSPLGGAHRYLGKARPVYPLDVDQGAVRPEIKFGYDSVVK